MQPHNNQHLDRTNMNSGITDSMKEILVDMQTVEPNQYQRS